MTVVSTKKSFNSNADSVIVINFGLGNLEQGFPFITTQLWSIDYPLPQQITGNLPDNKTLVNCFQEWRDEYQNLLNILGSSRWSNKDNDEDDWEVEELPTAEKLEGYSSEIQTQLNQWLMTAGFAIIEQKLRSQLDQNSSIRLILETDDDILRRLPWHLWTFLEDHPLTEIALSRPNYLRHPIKKILKTRKKVRILAIVGNTNGIDEAQEKQWLNNLSDAEVNFLIKPSHSQLNQYLSNFQGWDILFFAGHSQTEGETGRLYINDQKEKNHNSITIKQLKESLKEALTNGLQLAIFNSCDGLGLGNDLASLYIPLTIVMREPVPNGVAQAFFHQFLQGYTQEKLPFYLAFKRARNKLQSIENDYPGASWLPIIFQNPAFFPPSWLQLGGIPPCPYRGLLAFQEADAEVFYGRKTIIKNLVNLVKKNPLVPLVAASGSGKSSVIFAGLIPQLRQDSQLNWQIIWLRPSQNPFEGLGKALAPLINNSVTRIQELELELNLASNYLKIKDSLESIIKPLGNSSRLLLVIDQFEELFTLCQPSQCQGFLDDLVEAIKKVPAFSVVITLRADFLDKVLESGSFGELLQRYETQYLLPMQRDELEAAITQPAALNGVQFEAGLVDKLIDEVWGEAGYLPLLEFALTQLWSQQEKGWLTHQAYQNIGGVTSALANYAESVYVQLSEEDREHLQKIFIQLVNVGDNNKYTRRIATKEQVKYWDLVTQLASHRLVITNRPDETGKETVEMVHETLIYSWQRFYQWIEDNQDFLHWNSRLAMTLYQWESHEKASGYLLKETPLLEAKNWYKQRFDELSDIQIKFIENSLKLRRRNQIKLVSLTSIVTLSIFSILGLAWTQYQQKQLEQLIRYASSQVITSDNINNVMNILPNYLDKVNKNQNQQDFEKVMGDYRQVLMVATNTNEAIQENPDNFKISTSQKQQLKEIAKQAESSLAEMIYKYRIPRLKQQLENQEFGSKKVSNNLNNNPNEIEIDATKTQYTGALETTYNIIMNSIGVKADQNNNQILDEGEENLIPCETLKEIEKIWRKATNNHCGWYGSQEIFEPNCQELLGHTLLSILMYPPDIPLLDNRLNYCQIKPE
ncbi:CHAT domain-containing protein [Crocosphaera sp. UHCC 0190]|uniref:nSTAND1 domain-containing NTPase n=1 Tax=Crocosphaera sp. UHCC 0190 TaxID=3110246 RepID=UPI002B21D628|nr:CHAT domain-containing protein [Crocosphaera sp. UHCC 0190]MEA5511585.1 CHAT domain-containing protein [Crocosphaera sp. UHCC 0190]